MKVEALLAADDIEIVLNLMLLGGHAEYREPRSVLMLFGQNDRHLGMDLSHKLIRFAGDDRTVRSHTPFE